MALSGGDTDCTTSDGMGLLPLDGSQNGMLPAFDVGAGSRYASGSYTACPPLPAPATSKITATERLVALCIVEDKEGEGGQKHRRRPVRCRAAPTLSGRSCLQLQALPSLGPSQVLPRCALSRYFQVSSVSNLQSEVTRMACSDGNQLFAFPCCCLVIIRINLVT